MTDTARLKQTFGQLILCLCYPSKHVNVGPTCVSHGLQGYRVGMGSKWASYLGPTWVTQLGPTWVNPGGILSGAHLGDPARTHMGEPRLKVLIIFVVVVTLELI